MRDLILLAVFLGGNIWISSYVKGAEYLAIAIPFFILIGIIKAICDSVFDD